MKKVISVFAVFALATLFAVTGINKHDIIKANAMTGYHTIPGTSCVNKAHERVDNAECNLPSECSLNGSLPKCSEYHRVTNACVADDNDSIVVANHFCDDPDPVDPSKVNPNPANSGNSGEQTYSHVDECLSNHEISPSLTRAEKIEQPVAVEGASVSAPSEEEAGACASTWGITVDKKGINLPAEYNGHAVNFFIYSSPKFLGSATVENGRYNVDLSSFSGTHRILLVNNNNEVIGETTANFSETIIAKTAATSVVPFAALFAFGSAFAFAFAIRRKKAHRA